jgi:hypothetical protein
MFSPDLVREFVQDRDLVTIGVADPAGVRHAVIEDR